MPTIEGLILCKRISDGGHQMHPVILGYGTTGDAFTDDSEQLDVDVPNIPIMVVRCVVAPTTATVLQADSNFIVVGSRRVNDDGTISNSTFDDALTAGQRNAFRTWVTNNFPNAPAGVVTKINNTVQIGDTRIQAFRKLSAVLRRWAELRG